MSVVDEVVRVRLADPDASGRRPDSRPHSSSPGSLLAELPPRVRARVDTSVFARLDGAERLAVERLAQALGSHVVAYDLRVAGERLPLCATVAQADLDREQIAALRAAEQGIGPWIALVAYARPVEPRPSPTVGCDQGPRRRR